MFAPHYHPPSMNPSSFNPAETDSLGDPFPTFDPPIEEVPQKCTEQICHF